MNCNDYIRRVAGVTRTYAWTILTNGEPESLEGRNLTLVLVHPRGREEIMEFGAIDNVVTFTWQGDDQKDIGRYSIILYENYGEENQLRVDIHNFVELVPWSDRESGDYADLTEESESLESDVIREEVLVVDNLLSTSASSALSANMGRVLNEAKYEKPVTGIPKSDLASAVQSSLEKADVSVQNMAGSSGGVLIKASGNSNASVRMTETSVVIQGRAGSVTVDDNGVSVQTGNSGFPDAKMYYNGYEVATLHTTYTKTEVDAMIAAHYYDAGGATS